eukprot:scaffold67435_cov100-Phaeocystis_antarctica.AAC.3
MRSATPRILAVQPKPARFMSSSRIKNRLHFSRNWLANSAPYQPSGLWLSGLNIASPSNGCCFLAMLTMPVRLALPQLGTPGGRPNGRMLPRLMLGGSREQATTILLTGLPARAVLAAGKAHTRQYE